MAGSARIVSAMARTQVTVVTDDLNGETLEDNTEPTRFGLEGKEYEIDLGAENVAALRDALAPYVKAGRPVKATRKRRSTNGS